MKEFENDMKRIAELAGKNGVGEINLMGGEPLLHPDVGEFVKIARRFFPATRVQITTNGLLLKKQPDLFWENCRKNNVIIVATKYSININWEIIQNKAKAENVRFEFYGRSGTVLKSSYHIPFDITGGKDTAINFLQCSHANLCRELYRGRFYTCTVIPHAKHFNRAFGYELSESEADSIDIYKVNSINEILDFLAKSIPFCRFCNILGRSYNHPWQQSKKEMSEWVVS